MCLLRGENLERVAKVSTIFSNFADCAHRRTVYDTESDNERQHKK